MMPGAKTNFRIGLFVIGAITGTVIAILVLGWGRSRTNAVRYQTYFDETVQGLDLGSPVKYRGVRIGSVSDISIAPDRRLVSIGLDVSRPDAVRLGLDREPSRLRTQLATQGITGVKFIDIDVAEPAAPAPPVLSFAPKPRYIPSRPSLLTGLQENVELTMRKLPSLLERSTYTLDSLRRVLDDLHSDRVSARLRALIDNVDGAATDTRRWLASAKQARLPEHAASLLQELRGVAVRLDGAIAQLDGTGALIASAKRATDSIGDVGRSARSTASELETALRELAEGARAVRELAEMLERDPDALVRGRSTPRTR